MQVLQRAQNVTAGAPQDPALCPAVAQHTGKLFCFAGLNLCQSCLENLFTTIGSVSFRRILLALNQLESPQREMQCRLTAQRGIQLLWVFITAAVTLHGASAAQLEITQCQLRHGTQAAITTAAADLCQVPDY